MSEPVQKSALPSRAARAVAIMSMTSGVTGLPEAVQIYLFFHGDATRTLEHWSQRVQFWSLVEHMTDAEWWQEVQSMAALVDEAQAQLAE